MNRYVSIIIRALARKSDQISYSGLSDFSMVPVFMVFLIWLVPLHLFAQTTEVSSKHEPISSELSYLEMQQFGDFSIRDALARIPGIQVGSEGDINLRGVGYHRYNVTVDGQRMGSTGFGDRSIDLGSISIDQIRDLEVIKVLTPDMDADALSGVINLRTHTQMVTERELSVSIGGGANPQYFRLTGPTSKLSVHYSEPLRDDVSLSVNLSYQQDFRGRDGVLSEYDVADFGSDPVDVLERVSPFMETDERDRIGGGLRLAYQPSDRATYYVRGLLNHDIRKQTSHRNSMSANGNWVAQDTTAGQGRYSYDLNTSKINIEQYMVKVGAVNTFDFLQLDYNLGWTQSRTFKTGYHFPFMAQGVAYSIDMDNRMRPDMLSLNALPHPRNMRLQDMNYLIDNHIDTRLSGGLNLAIPFNTGTIKFGGSILSSDKDANDEGAFGDYVFSSRLPQNLNDFDLNRIRSADVLDNNYNLPHLLDVEGAKEFFESGLPSFATQSQIFHMRSDIWNYGASEQIYGTYGMTTLHFGMISVMAGLRAEFTEATYDGRVVVFGRFGRYQETVDTSSTTSYSNLFPNAQIKVTPGDLTTLHFAYSQTMSRNDYNILAPFDLVTAQDTSVFRGNPDLKPMTASNFDFQLEQQLGKSGTFTIGAYYKSLQKFVVQKEQRIDVLEGEIASFDYIFDENEDITVVSARETSFQNSDKTATVYGMEIALRQRLTFLPGLLRNFGVYGNYMWSQSDFDIGREESIALPQHSPHVVNVSLDYDHRSFYTRLTYHWTAEALTSLGDFRRVAPSIDPQEEVYLDQYSDGWSDLSLSAGFQISTNFHLWAIASNLLGSEQVSYNQNRDFYPVGITRRADRGLMLGIQFNL